jgi:uncharacterized protein YbaP (TraB family)
MLRSLSALLPGRLAGVSIAIAFSAALAGAAQNQPACPPEAKPPSPAQISEGMRTARDRGFLFRITKAEQTSYLYGTVHVGRMEWVFPGPEVQAALRSAEIVALEVDVLDPDLVSRLQEGMALKPDHALPEALNSRLRAQLKAACLPEHLLTTTSPEMVATTLTMMSARGSGLDPSYAVDAVYAGLARRLKKPVSSLETPELQLKLLLGRTPQETQAAVESALTDLESGASAPMMIHMAQVWADGRLGELENYEAWCGCLETEADRIMMRRLLDDRNPGLAKSIDAIHASGTPVFAAVGSLHMVGPLGLPALLAARGYKVERVNFKP